MNILKEIKAAILRAKEDRQSCPVCRALVMPSEGTGDDEIWYDHDCECLMERNLTLSYLQTKLTQHLMNNIIMYPLYDPKKGKVDSIS